jgi:hypothetical protein
MSTIHLHQTTTSTPEQYVAGLTDFGPGRSKLFGNSADEYLKGLGAFMRAVTELFGPEQARVAAEDWVDELEFVDILPEPAGRDWRSVTYRRRGPSCKAAECRRGSSNATGYAG